MCQGTVLQKGEGQKAADLVVVGEAGWGGWSAPRLAAACCTAGGLFILTSLQTLTHIHILGFKTALVPSDCDCGFLRRVLLVTAALQFAPRSFLPTNFGGSLGALKGVFSDLGRCPSMPRALLYMTERVAAPTAF